MKTHYFNLSTILLVVFLSITSMAASITATAQRKSETKASIQTVAENLAVAYVRDGSINTMHVVTLNQESINIPNAESIVLLNKMELKQLPAANWRMAVGRDVIVPIINIQHPQAKDWMKNGITEELLANLLNDSQTAVVENLELTQLLESYTNQPKTTWNVQMLNTDQLVISQVENNPEIIGFCKFSALKNAIISGEITQINLLPIDRNSNGTIDHIENFYNESSSFERAVWLGKYPRELTNTYFIASATQLSETQLLFARWAMQNGQTILAESGIGQLPATELHSNMAKLNNIPVAPLSPITQNNWLKLILPTMGLLLIIGLLSSTIYLRKKNSTVVDQSTSNFTGNFDESKLNTPAGLLFDRTHTWTLMQKDGILKMGVDEFLLKTTGPLTRLKMKVAGEKVSKGDPIISLNQNGKSISIFSPVTGVIKKSNQSLEKNISQLNNSPYDSGWLYEIEPTNWQSENQIMMMVDTYSSFIKNEMKRLRDFFAQNNAIGASGKMQLVLQDGGEIMTGALKDCCPEMWEQFQTQFINPSR